MIKFVKASIMYHEFIKMVYREEEGLAERSYQEQYDHIVSYHFAWSDFWKKNLNKRDDVEAEQLFFSVEPLQKMWAKENNVPFKEESWLTDIFTAQIKQLQPNVLFYHETNFFSGDYRIKLREEVKSIVLTIGHDGVAHLNPEMYKGIDLMMSCLERVADFYTKNGFDGMYHPFGFEASILDKIEKRDKRYDATFAGSLSILMEGGHHERLKLVSHLARKTNIDLFINNKDMDHWHPLCWPQRQRLWKGNFEQHFHIWQIGKRNQTPRFGLDMYQLLADSRMTINNHIDVAQNKAANMRLMEASGVGTCLVTDWKENIGEFFEEDYEVVTYKSKEECVEKINWLKKNPEKCREIGLAGQKRTLATSTVEIRANELIDYIIENYPEVRALV